MYILAKGDSMLPTLTDGEYYRIEPIDNGEISPKDIIVFNIDGIISCLSLLFINLQMLLAKDIRGKRLLDIVNALARKIRLLRSGRPYHHVDVRVGFLVVIGGDPAKI